jgi:hypothetical protein
VTAPVVAPGDVICTRSTGWKARGIRFVAAIRDQPNLQNHVAVVHHLDDRGTLWCLEGKPGGVGWHTAGGYLQSPWTLTNAAQPKTDAQRKIICDGMLAMIGTEYDWEAIADDAVADVFGLRDLWQPTWDKDEVPGQVVCSSWPPTGTRRPHSRAPRPMAAGSRPRTRRIHVRHDLTPERAVIALAHQLGHIPRSAPSAGRGPCLPAGGPGRA